MGNEQVVELAGWRARRGALLSPITGGASGDEAGRGSHGAAFGDTPLEALTQGLPGAVEACLEAYAPMVQGLATRLLPSGSDVEDVVQEIFVELWRTADRYDPARASDRGYVAMIARRRIIDRRRRMEARPVTESLPDRDVYSGTDHERTLGRVQAAPAVAALRTLNEDWQKWIVMNVVEGYSHADIARITQSPLGTVKTGIRRGLQRMREWLSEAGSMEEGR